MSGWRIGIDSGGTFTDVCLFKEDSGVEVWKLPSTPDDPSRAIAAGFEEIIRRHSEAGVEVHIEYFGHGTTVATNALIEHKGANIGLITTDGFRDLLEIARQRRPDLYDLECDKPACLVPRDQRLEVPERIRHDGRIYRPLDEHAVREAARRLRDLNVLGVAVCFLYSYVAPDHEKRVCEILRQELPDVFISASHEIAPEFREYERLSTVVVNVYVGPVVESYLRSLRDRMNAFRGAPSPYITQSNGGAITVEVAAREPVRTLLSGPATGVTGAVAFAEAAVVRNAITFDMGGTSTDVSLIEEGAPLFARDSILNGYPLKTPMFDIHTVGAGGGSIAHVDSGGFLKVGPMSAGASPGPACYGKGMEPTVCDANVVLQTLNPTALLGGQMPIDCKRSRDAIARLGDRLHLDVMTTAQGVISIVVSNMAKAIRVITVQRGRDPRDYTLIAFGGAGPLHAARLARELEIPRVLVPRYPGLLCAMGLLLSDLKRHFSQTRPMILEEVGSDIMLDAFLELEKRAIIWFDAEKIDDSRRVISWSVDARYLGQNYELNIPVTPTTEGSDLRVSIRSVFDRAHKLSFDYEAPQDLVQLVTFRVEAVAKVPKPELPSCEEAETTDPGSAAIGTRMVWLSENRTFIECQIFDRARLQYGHIIAGPAVVEQMDSMVLILPDTTAHVDKNLNIIMEMNP